MRKGPFMLCKDGRSVVLYADDADGNPVESCFTLAERVSEDAFDPTPYREAFETGCHMANFKQTRPRPRVSARGPRGGRLR